MGVRLSPILLCYLWTEYSLDVRLSLFSVIIMSDTFEQHITKLHKVLSRLESASLDQTSVNLPLINVFS